MEPLIDATMRHWVENVSEKFAKSHEKFDLAPWAS